MNEFNSVDDMFSKESLLDTKKYIAAYLFWSSAERRMSGRSLMLKTLKDRRKEFVYSDLKAKKEQIIESFDSKCCVCGFSFEPILQLHHILPVSKFGGNSDGNVICVCPNCHKMLHTAYKAWDKDDEDAMGSIWDAYDKDSTSAIWKILKDYNERMCEVSDFIKGL